MGGLVDLIVDKYDGSLKAEHGTGLNMAPYVEREWGAKATEMMWRIKALADPAGVLAPGVLLNRDPGVHLRNLKSIPRSRRWPTPAWSAASASRCARAGTSPRRRASGSCCAARWRARRPGRRSRGAARASTNTTRIETCAGDGTCMLACPLGIDTGKLVKELRARAAHGPRGAGRAGGRRRWAAWSAALERGLRARPPAARRRSAGARRDARRCGAAVSHELVPAWPGGHAAPGGAAAGDAARGRGGRVSAGLREPHLRPRARRRADREPAGGAGRRSRARRARRSGSRPTWPATAARRRGARRATGRATRTWPPARSRRCGGGRGEGQPAGRDRRQLVLPSGADRGRARRDRGAGLDRVGARPPAAGADGAQPAAERPRCTRPAQPATWA